MKPALSSGEAVSNSQFSYSYLRNKKNSLGSNTEYRINVWRSWASLSCAGSICDDDAVVNHSRKRSDGIEDILISHISIPLLISSLLEAYAGLF